MTMRLMGCCCAAMMTFLLPGCITKRTVTEGGRTVDQSYVIKRPITNAIKKMEIE